MIGPLLRVVRPTPAVAAVLRWEGVLIDPIGALLAVFVYTFIVSAQAGHTLAAFAGSIGVGCLTGLLAGLALAEVLRRHWVPEYLRGVTTLAWVLLLFVVANAAAHEGGLVAVTTMGILLANVKGLDLEDILSFKESLSVMLIGALFIVLAARVDLTPLLGAWRAAAAVLLVVLFVARPVAVLAATLGSKLAWRERALVAWIAPRGIVAAAVSALFSLRLEALGYERAPLLVALTFMVILVTVVAQSTLTRPLARRLGVMEPEPHGALVVGGHQLGLAVAKALQERGLRVVLADINWGRVQQARMQGLDTYYGDVVSEHADRHLDLAGIGCLLALVDHSSPNALACLRYRSEFGAANVYAVRTGAEGDGAGGRRERVPRLRCRPLFREDATLGRLMGLLEEGYRVRATTLTEAFDYPAWRTRHQSRAIPLFALDRGGRLRVFSGEEALRPEPGWTLLALAPPAEAEPPAAA